MALTDKDKILLMEVKNGLSSAKDLSSDLYSKFSTLSFLLNVKAYRTSANRNDFADLIVKTDSDEINSIVDKLNSSDLNKTVILRLLELKKELFEKNKIDNYQNIIDITDNIEKEILNNLQLDEDILSEKAYKNPDKNVSNYRIVTTSFFSELFSKKDANKWIELIFDKYKEEFPQKDINSYNVFSFQGMTLQNFLLRNKNYNLIKKYLKPEAIFSFSSDKGKYEDMQAHADSFKNGASEKTLFEETFIGKNKSIYKSTRTAPNFLANSILNHNINKTEKSKDNLFFTLNMLNEYVENNKNNVDVIKSVNYHLNCNVLKSGTIADNLKNLENDKKLTDNEKDILEKSNCLLGVKESEKNIDGLKLEPKIYFESKFLDDGLILNENTLISVGKTNNTKALKEFFYNFFESALKENDLDLVEKLFSLNVIKTIRNLDKAVFNKLANDISNQIKNIADYNKKDMLETLFRENFLKLNNMDIGGISNKNINIGTNDDVKKLKEELLEIEKYKLELQSLIYEELGRNIDKNEDITLKNANKNKIRSKVAEVVSKLPIIKLTTFATILGKVSENNYQKSVEKKLKLVAAKGDLIMQDKITTEILDNIINSINAKNKDFGIEPIETISSRYQKLKTEFGNNRAFESQKRNVIRSSGKIILDEQIKTTNDLRCQIASLVNESDKNKVLQAEIFARTCFNDKNKIGLSFEVDLKQMAIAKAVDKEGIFIENKREELFNKKFSTYDKYKNYVVEKNVLEKLLDTENTIETKLKPYAKILLLNEYIKFCPKDKMVDFLSNDNIKNKFESFVEDYAKNDNGIILDTMYVKAFDNFTNYIKEAGLGEDIKNIEPFSKILDGSYKKNFVPEEEKQVNKKIIDQQISLYNTNEQIEELLNSGIEDFNYEDFESLVNDYEEFKITYNSIMSDYFDANGNSKCDTVEKEYEKDSLMVKATLQQHYGVLVDIINTKKVLKDLIDSKPKGLGEKISRSSKIKSTKSVLKKLRKNYEKTVRNMKVLSSVLYTLKSNVSEKNKIPLIALLCGHCSEKINIQYNGVANSLILEQSLKSLRSSKLDKGNYNITKNNVLNGKKESKIGMLFKKGFIKIINSKFGKKVFGSLLRDVDIQFGLRESKVMINGDKVKANFGNSENLGITFGDFTKDGFSIITKNESKKCKTQSELLWIKMKNYLKEKNPAIVLCDDCEAVSFIDSYLNFKEQQDVSDDLANISSCAELSAIQKVVGNSLAGEFVKILSDEDKMKELTVDIPNILRSPILSVDANKIINFNKSLCDSYDPSLVLKNNKEINDEFVSVSDIINNHAIEERNNNRIIANNKEHRNALNQNQNVNVGVVI